MELFGFLGPLFAKLQDPTVLVLALGCLGLGYLHVVWRREEREDRAKMLEAFTHLVEALNQVKVAIAAVTGKAV